MEEEVQDNVWPLPKFYFYVKFSSLEDAVVFQEVSGLDIENDAIEYRHNQFSTTQMPGIAKMGTITLKKGIFRKKSDFFTWYESLKENIIKRETVTVQLLDEKGNPTMTWKLLNAWITRVSGSDFKSEVGEIAVETITLEHEGLTIAQG